MNLKCSCSRLLILSKDTFLFLKTSQFRYSGKRKKEKTCHLKTGFCKSYFATKISQVRKNRSQSCTTVETTKDFQAVRSSLEMTKPRQATLSNEEHVSGPFWGAKKVTWFVCRRRNHSCWSGCLHFWTLNINIQAGFCGRLPDNQNVLW